MAAIANVIPPISVKTVVACLLWYLTSSVTSQLTKVILLEFPYPLFLSQFQFLIGLSLSLSAIVAVKQFPDISSHFPENSLPRPLKTSVFDRGILLKVLPLGVFQFIGKYFSLCATSLVSLATVSSVKALSPVLIVLGYRLIYKVSFPFVTYLSLAPLVGGVILIILSDSYSFAMSPGAFFAASDYDLDYDQVKGLTFCLVSSIIFAAQNIYGKQLFASLSDIPKSNPAALVLNTDASRPTTPSIDEESLPVTTNNDGDFLEPKVLSDRFRIFARKRDDSTLLPYSTSDIRVDEKVREQHKLFTPYFEQARTSTSLGYAISSIKGSVPTLSVSPANEPQKPDKISIIFYCSMIGFVFSFSGFVVNEMPRLLSTISPFGTVEDSGTIQNQIQSQTLTLNQIQNQIQGQIKGQIEGQSQLPSVIKILVLILLDSLSHFLQTLLSFHLLELIPALSYSIASMMKRIVIITVSIVLAIGISPSTDPQDSKWLGKFTTKQLYGLILIAVGLYCYDRWGSRSLKANRV